MAAVVNNLYSTQFASVDIGSIFLVPDGLNEVESSFKATSYAGIIIPQIDMVFIPKAEASFPFERNYYHALKAGYDVISTSVGPSNWDTLVTVNNIDGTSPSHAAPTAVGDNFILSASKSEIKLSDLVLNDIVPVAGLVGGLQVRAGSGELLIDVDMQTQRNDLTIYIGPSYSGPSGEAFIGTATVEYRVQDLLGQFSNWASIQVDYLGNNTSRSNILGWDNITEVATSDVIDFSRSNLAVGVHGLGGDDTIRGSQAGDNLNGDDGADRIGGKGGNDIINGGNGNDTLFGDAGNDTIDGGADNDTLWGGDGNDIIRGGLGNDQVYGEAGDDQVGGKAGNDAVYGGAGNDTIWGDEGNDALYGDAGNDNLNGGAGNDFLTGGLGIDRMRGEAGVDTFVFMRGQAQGDTVLDFEGAGIVGGDKIEFRGYGAGATVHQVSGDTWQIDAAGISETFKIAGVSNLSKVDFYFT